MDVRNMIIGSLLVGVIIIGFTTTFNGWYQNAGSNATLDTTALNITHYQTYLANWANQTAALVGNSQAVPFFGTGYVLAIGVYQAITLIVQIPTQVIIPLFQGIATTLGLPSWFVGFAIVVLLVGAIIGIINAAKGGLL